MTQHIVIIGAGFAGLMAALSAARLRDEKGVSPKDLKITVVAPEPALVVRPRLYERNPASMVARLDELFAATDIDFHAGHVDTIDSENGTIGIGGSEGQVSSLRYDRLVVATGSHGFQPPIPGLSDFGHNVTDFEGAVALDRHLHALAERPSSVARNTVVVGGGGFTGIEVATEMPQRLREILGQDTPIRVIMVERGPVIAPDMGNEPRPYIEARLRELDVQTVLGSGIVRLDGSGVTLENGEQIETETVVWSAGMRASPLTAQLPAERDNLGRILVAPDLRVPGSPRIFATGDTAKAATDNDGNFSLMSCQHARRLGAFAGHNAAADLLGEPTLAYDQPSYVVCLDLGADDAIFTRGWSPRTVEITGAEAKKVKMDINAVWIYPPAAEREAAFRNAFEARTVDF
ncbi:pyridine nucleotide-disulfide oxidoreductase [Novosphingobium indicum]|uniref:Pyridine nucleotide-disulfide oxidoreductase n=1 Tax=Novosphingobium indicum TaxID=462949 RepID=A0ABQ2JU14_9SPHN|nr:FAD-dependent oxidoreductase [Novosphingobium indicum]GGN54116.1 pyridine nucleotide-disulfide oxidoreductase [Novosphingobium indicum]